MLWSEIMMVMATVGNREHVLRETPNFIARSTANGVRITAKDDSVTPRSKIVAQETWNQLSRMSDAEFDGSCLLDMGIGVFQEGDNLPRVLTEQAG